MANWYDKGDLIRLSAAFTIDGALVDPTTITLKVRDPGGHIDIYTYALTQITKDATGQYHKDISIDESGMWVYRWEGTGAVIAAGESFLRVLKSKF